jgi:uncharacterized RDD family membrane protein YckC
MKKIHEIIVERSLDDVWQFFFTAENWKEWFEKAPKMPPGDWQKGGFVNWEPRGTYHIDDIIDHDSIQFSTIQNKEKWFFINLGSNKTKIIFENESDGFVDNYEEIASAMMARLEKSIINRIPIQNDPEKISTRYCTVFDTSVSIHHIHLEKAIIQACEHTCIEGVFPCKQQCLYSFGAQTGGYTSANILGITLNPNETIPESAILRPNQILQIRDFTLSAPPPARSTEPAPPPVVEKVTKSSTSPTTIVGKKAAPPPAWAVSEVRRLVNYIVDISILFLIENILILNFHELESYPGLQSLVFFPLVFLYYTLSETFLQKTPAKFLTGTKVIMEDGTKPGFGAIAARTLIRLIPFEVISVIGSPKQTRTWWHDRWSHTRVVKANVEYIPEQIESPSTTVYQEIVVPKNLDIKPVHHTKVQAEPVILQPLPVNDAEKQVGPMIHKSPLLSALLSILFLGGGQVYNGQWIKGLLIIFTSLGLLISNVTFLRAMGILILVFAIADAFGNARKLNGGATIGYWKSYPSWELGFAALILYGATFAILNKPDASTTRPAAMITNPTVVPSISSIGPIGAVEMDTPISPANSVPQNPSPTREPLPEATKITGIPIVSNVDLIEENTANGKIIYQDIFFTDSDGDVNSVDYHIISANTEGLSVEGGDVDINSDQQKVGSVIRGKWGCGDAKYSVTLTVIVKDRLGHHSTPYPYTLHCGD